MKRAAFVVALLASVQTAQAQSVQDHMGGAVYQTVRNAILSTGVSESDPLFGATVSGISTAISGYANIGGNGLAVLTWAAVLRAVMPDGASVGYGGYAGGGGGFDGGGASGGWDPCDFDWKLSPDGDLIVPAMHLATGGPMTRSPGSSAYYWVPKTNTNGTDNIMADKPPAAVLWALHKKNAQQGSVANYWYGVYKTDGDRHYYSRPSSYLPNGTKIGAIFGYINPSLYTSFIVTGANQDCPQSGNGGDFDFYHGNTAVTILGNWSQCTMYAPNFSISSTGYFYPEVVAWPKADIPTWPIGAPDFLKTCKLDPSLIKRVVDAAWDKAQQTPGYTGLPRPPATPVKTDGTDPTVDDLKNDPRNALPTEGSGVDPSPSPTPTTPSGSSGGTTNVTLDLGPAGSESLKADSALDAPDFGWWPEAPAITIAGSTTCPTYAFDAFGEHYEVTVHCQFAEQNRALISAIMILVFTIAAARIVLEA